MLITRRNYDEVLNVMNKQSVDAVVDHLHLNKPMAIVQRNKLILDLMRPKTKLFVGKSYVMLINLTEYKLYTHYQGMSQDESIRKAQWSAVRMRDNMYYFHPNTIYDYVAPNKAKDPWNQMRDFIHVNKVEGFHIHNVIPNKKTVIASLLFYDGYNIYQSKQMQFSMHRGLWYMHTANNAYYANIESNINILYSIQNY